MTDSPDSALLHALLDAAPDAIIISDCEGAILRLNKAAARTFGHKVEDLTGRNVSVLMPPDMARRHDGFMRRHLETGENRIIGTGRETEGQRADGGVFPLHLSVGRAEIDGQTAFVAILHDQTRRKAAEEAAARSQRMEAIGQMTGGIAHDFNNLLSVVIGNLELLDMVETSDRSRELIADALEAAELGADLTSRLMVFSRKSSVPSEVIDINETLRHSLVMLRRTIGAHVKIDADLAADLWPTRADATQLQTAILNLALNAQDAMPEGGRLQIETRNITLDDQYMAQEIGVATGDYIRLSVSDTGEGMSDEARNRAIEPFFTTKPVGKGTGLGLSMVYGFVKQAGGHLTIYSEPGEGTTINLYFPALAVDAQAGPGQAEAEGDPNAALGAGRLVLIVEDDPRVRRSSEARLGALGFRCLTAPTGDAAWQMLRDRDDIALVFTDLVMPGSLSGHDLALRIARLKPGVPVLMTSGFSEGVLRGGRIGAEFAILRKPYRQSDLVRAVQDVLGGS